MPVQITVRLPDDLADALAAEADRTRQSRQQTLVAIATAKLIGRKPPGRRRARVTGGYRGCDTHPRAGAVEARGRFWCAQEGCLAPARPAA